MTPESIRSTAAQHELLSTLPGESTVPWIASEGREVGGVHADRCTDTEQITALARRDARRRRQLGPAAQAIRQELTSLQVLAFQRLVGNRAVGALLAAGGDPSRLSAPATSPCGRRGPVVQRQFWEYTGHLEPPNDTDLEGHVTWHDEPPTGAFQEIQGLTFKRFPVCRRQTGTSEVAPSKASKAALVKTHRRMHSVHSSVMEEKPAAEPGYPSTHVLALARDDPRYGEAGSPILVFDDGARQGDTMRLQSGKYRCAIGKQAFDKDHRGNPITDPHQRFVHALLCIRHEIEHAHQSQHGVRGHYSQEFAVRLGDRARAQTSPIPQSWGLESRPLLAYVSMVIAQADEEYLKLAPEEHPEDARGQWTSALEFIMPPAAQRSGEEQTRLQQAGSRWLGSRFPTCPEALLKHETLPLVIGSLLDGHGEDEARVHSTVDGTLKSLEERKWKAAEETVRTAEKTEKTEKTEETVRATGKGEEEP